jgi:hypothetical protein
MPCSMRPTRNFRGIGFGRRVLAWTTMRIEVAGAKARLYVNGAEQPCLVVVETDADFGPITVTAR